MEMEMEMEKEKEELECSKPKDRLSELPDSLIFSIFEFLPMEDVVRTQFLSHRWKNLWTLTPYLKFFNYVDGSSDVFRNFVNRCLFSWRGTRVLHFGVWGCEYEDSTDVDLWVRFAVDNGVRKLHISFCGECDDEDGHFVPQCLYSCSSLHDLSLEGFSMDIRGNVEWNKLKSLTIESLNVSAHAINQILCGSPLLEGFTAVLGETESNTNLCFRSSILKQLLICKLNHDGHKNSELEIWTPNVEKLMILGIPYAKCLLMNVSSLTEAILSLSGCRDRVERSLSQILPAIQHVKELTLSHWCIKALENRKSRCFLSPLPNVKCLNLRGSFEEHEQIVELLEIFPKLKTLVVLERNRQYDATSKSKLKFKPNPSKPFLEELTTVDVTCTKHDWSILPLIKSLLKYASKLEIMMLRVKETALPSLPLEELLSMRRSSPTAEWIFR